MKSFKEIRFISRSTVREIAILVIGIMIAFSLDAWWDRISIRSNLQEHAGLVLDEMRATEDELDRAVLRHKDFADKAHWMIQRLEQTPSGSTVSVSDTTLHALLLQSTIDIGTSSLVSFLNAGGASLIDAPEDRTLIRLWPTVADDIMDDQVYLRDTYTVPLAAFIRSNYDLEHSEFNNLMYLAGTRFDMPELLDELEIQSVQLQPDVPLINLLNARYAIETLTWITLADRLETIRELIQIMERID